MALVEIGLPDAFASLGQHVRVRGVRVRINLPRTVYKVLDLRIRYLASEGHFTEVRVRGHVAMRHTERVAES